MLAKIIISGLDRAEANAKEILEHVEAIKCLQAGTSWAGIQISVELKAENFERMGDVYVEKTVHMRKRGGGMNITIEGEPKEIAALVLELQERQGEVPVDDLADAIIARLRELQQQAWQKCINTVIPPEGTMHTLTADEMPHLVI